MLWWKAWHIIAIVAWFAGLFYLPRLFVYHADAKYNKISSALTYAWKNGLKTASYYTRTKSKIETNKKLSVQQDSELPKRPKDSPFECAGGGCSA